MTQTALPTPFDAFFSDVAKRAKSKSKEKKAEKKTEVSRTKMPLDWDKAQVLGLIFQVEICNCAICQTSQQSPGVVALKKIRRGEVTRYLPLGAQEVLDMQKAGFTPEIETNVRKISMCQHCYKTFNYVPEDQLIPGMDYLG